MKQTAHKDSSFKATKIQIFGPNAPGPKKSLKSSFILKLFKLLSFWIEKSRKNKDFQRLRAVASPQTPLPFPNLLKDLCFIMRLVYSFQNLKLARTTTALSNPSGLALNPRG